MRLLPLPGVFEPPSDAWMVVHHLRERRLAAGATVLDLCTGSGVLAIAAALSGASEVTAIDISRRAVVAVKLNAWVNRVRVEAKRGDLFAPVAQRRFDLIVSNPPYLPGEETELPRRGLARAWEGGPTGRAFIERIAAEAQRHLTERGVLLLTFSTVCDEPRTLAGLSSAGLSPRVVDRRRGPLGQLLSARAGWLHRQGLLLGAGEEEILVVQASRSVEPGLAPGPGNRERGRAQPERPEADARARPFG